MHIGGDLVMKSQNLNFRKVSIEEMKRYAAALADYCGIKSKRDRNVRGINLINQLLRCYRIGENEVFFEIGEMDVKYACRPLKDRHSPVFKLKHKEKTMRMYYTDESEKPKKYKYKATKGTLTMTVIIPENNDESESWYSTRITVTASCILNKHGAVYTELIRKLLYIYICSYIMKTRNFIGLKGLQLHIPYTDMRCDHMNKIKIA